MKTNSIYKSAAGAQAVQKRYDELLSGWPVPNQQLTVSTRYGDTFVLASGQEDARPLVLIHGSSSNALAWMGDVAALSERFRTLAVDVVGEPGRSAETRPPFVGPAFADWLGDVLDGLGLSAAALAGISQGGYIALKFAVAHPERVDRLVLLAPGGVAPVRTSFLARAIILSLAGKRGAEAINRITMGGQEVHPVAREYMDLIMTNFRPRVEAQPLFSDEELKRLTMPVLLVAGLRDALMQSERIALRLQELLPHLTVELLPEAGHVLHGVPDLSLPFLTAHGVL